MTETTRELPHARAYQDPSGWHVELTLPYSSDQLSGGWEGLTPADARFLAAELNDAADEAEAQNANAVELNQILRADHE